MDFEWTPEQQELRRTLRAFLEDAAPESELRRVLTAQQADAELWRRMSQELGLAGLAIPEAYGGGGCSQLELALVQEELGRALVCTPYFSSVALAANALLQIDDEAAQREWLPGIATGDCIATLAISEQPASWSSEDVALNATEAGDGWRLEGTKRFVTDGLAASLILVAARCDAGPGLFAVDGDADGLLRSALDPIDGSRKLADLELRGVRARPIGKPGETGPEIDRAIDLAGVALAAEQVGAAERLLELTVEYACERTQFGKPIGSFQAVKHRCADMLLDVEAARTATRLAAWSASEPTEDFAAMASMAQATASDAFAQVAESAIQVLGGIGFTWDHPAHLYLRRAQSARMLLGSPDVHRERMVERLALR